MSPRVIGARFWFAVLGGVVGVAGGVWSLILKLRISELEKGLPRYSEPVFPSWAAFVHPVVLIAGGLALIAHAVWRRRSARIRP